MFAALERTARCDAVLASNTSVIPISKIMRGLKDKSRALGTHWWNPPYLVPLVEVIGTRWTSAGAIERTIALHAAAGKTPVHVKKDVPGFVGNRLQHALWREAISLVENGICDAETVDTVIKASFGRRLAVLGPLENADLVGTDLTLAIHKTVLPAIDWTMALHKAAGKMPVHVKKDVPGFVGNRLQHALWREAIALVERGICDAETVDTVIKASFGRRLAVLGPLENADLVGTDLTLAIHKTVLPDIENRRGPSPYLEALVADGKLGFKSGEGFRKWSAEEQAALRATVLQHLKKARTSDA